MEFTAENLISTLNWRYAVKKFDSTKKILDKDWQALEESLRLSASSFGLQPWKFIIVQDKNLRKKLTSHSWDQTQIEDCSHLVVLAHAKKMDMAYVEKYLTRMSQVRGIPVASLDGFKQAVAESVLGDGPIAKKLETWTSRQTYIAMGTFLVAAALLKIDTCPMEGIDPEKYDEILGLNSTFYKTVAVIAAGYRSVEDKYQNLKKVRFEKKDVFEIR